MPAEIAPNVVSWARELDDQTIEQARRSASLPIIEGHVALMPDAHLGYGATVGSVIPTKGAVIPSAVGVDIGCGMIAAQLDLTAADLPDNLNPLHSMIAEAVPAGVGQGHKRDSIPDRLPLPEIDQPWWTPRLERKMVDQFGSLGSGNHFVEVCLDENDDVWVVLHSGSRGPGNELANIHIDGAKGLMKKHFADLPDPDLAYLVEGTPEFDAYIEDMLWAQDYAMANRAEMLSAILGCVNRFLGRPVPVVDQINCHHNFTELENHGGSDIWVTRKGAIRARTGDRGVIPGSMGAASYIVSGLGNPDSYNSCSHGAGRRLSRRAARRRLSAESLTKAMAGRTWNNNPKALLDEHPDAYKDIDEVMAAQTDLVTIEHRLHQILNYKGT